MEFSPKPPANIPQNTPEEKPMGEILDGKDAADLYEGSRTYTLECGASVIAGTDKGIDYKDHNEDRIVIAPSNNFVAVADGMGGHSKGDVAAQFLAEELLASPKDTKLAAANSVKRMEEKGLIESGAVFVSARIFNAQDGKYLEASQLGDSTLVVITRDGQVKFQSEEDSVTGRLVRDEVITPDQALYHGTRHMISSAVSPNPNVENRVPQPPSIVKLDPGDFILLMSDGISDNFTREEIALKIKEGFSQKDLFFWLSENSTRRMTDADKIIDSSDRKKDGIYSDGFKSKPKPDNRALVIVEIK